jgi:N-acetylmuramic acid 6-phosphate etherase
MTEARNPRSREIDRLSVEDAFDVVNGEDATVAAAVAAAKPQICAAVGLATAALRQGGRLIYVGAGTSGRLGVLDASECPPTFQTDPQQVQGVIAGGRDAVFRSVEGAEDDPDGGATAVREIGVGERDVVMGIAAGGTTPYVRGALAAARADGAKTVFLTCVPDGDSPVDVNVLIRVVTGPEVITGSTRMKAGTATKLVLNTITTLTMVQLGKVFGHYMVDLNTRANRKLQDRAIRIVAELTGLSRDASAELLKRAAGRVKVALVMHHRGVHAREAESLLLAKQARLVDVIRAGTDVSPTDTSR